MMFFLECIWGMLKSTAGDMMNPSKHLGPVPRLRTPCVLYTCIHVPLRFGAVASFTDSHSIIPPDIFLKIKNISYNVIL